MSHNNKLIIEQRPTSGGVSMEKEDETISSLTVPQIDNSQTTVKKKGTPLSSNEYTGIEFKFKYPNDKNYIYGIKNGDWYAKNVNNQKVFNISKDGFKSSVDNLNRQFPEALKPIDNTNTNEPNVQVKPDETQVDKIKKDDKKITIDTPVELKPFKPTKDSIGSNEKVLNKQEEPTIYNIDSNKEEL
jgi:hypothetical protein